LTLRTDLSSGLYIYAFPAQQMLAICGLIWLNPLLFFVVSAIATLPLAALSWFLVEKPAMSLKTRLKRRWGATPPLRHGGGERTGAAVGLVAEQPTPEIPGAA
jgi:peptidoglycan/LPS O-acetylase OafA/YrhL